jgi:hypothetical protein
MPQKRRLVIENLNKDLEKKVKNSNEVGLRGGTAPMPSSEECHLSSLHEQSHGMAAENAERR